MPSLPVMADVDMANMALSHLGISVTIQSLNPPDASQQATTLAFWYPKCLAECLQSAPWNFSYQCQAVVQETANSPTGAFLGKAYPGWAYSYQLPNDCLQPIAVVTTAGLRLSGQIWSSWWYPFGPGFGLSKIPFKLAQSLQTPGQMAIFCDLLASSGSPLYLFYIQYVTNTALFDPMFSTAFSYLLAWRSGGALRSDKQKIADCKGNYQSMRLDALAQHLNASQQDRERDAATVLIR